MKKSAADKTKRFHLTLGLTIVLCAFYLTTGYSQSKSGSKLLPEKVEQTTKVKALHSPSLPVRVKGEIISTDGPEDLTFRYDITNLTAGSVQDFEVALYILDKQGRVKGGEVWRLYNEVSAKATGSFSMQMTNKPKPDDTAVVVVQEVSQGRKTWRVDAIPFLRNAWISVNSDALATGRPVVFRPFACVESFCTDQAGAADVSCNAGGSCGVRTFTCNQNSCTASWSCHKCNGEEQ